MMKNITVRVLLGVVFGAAAGMSMALTIFPYATSWLAPDIGYSFSIVLSMTLPIISIWAVGGGVAGWQAQTVIGALALGGVGALSGGMLGVVVVEESSPLIAIGAFVGLAYGGVGGALIGYAFGSLSAD